MDSLSIEEVQAAVEGMREDLQEQWRQAAFVVWPHAARKGEDFAKFLKRLGLSDQRQTQPATQEEAQRARELAARARQELAERRYADGKTSA
ncbi:MAG: hypothetical protein ACOC1T_03665 [Halorhodospira sp.]